MVRYLSRDFLHQRLQERLSFNLNLRNHALALVELVDGFCSNRLSAPFRKATGLSGDPVPPLQCASHRDRSFMGAGRRSNLAFVMALLPRLRLRPSKNLTSLRRCRLLPRRSRYAVGFRNDDKRNLIAVAITPASVSLVEKTDNERSWFPTSCAQCEAHHIRFAQPRGRKVKSIMCRA
jgi:hypothetical protein